MLFRSGGWRLEYSAAPNVRMAGSEAQRGYRNYLYSLGMMVSNSGMISDVAPGTPAWNAGLAPGMRLIGRNGQKFSNDALAETITAAATSSLPISLQADNGGVIGNYTLDYHGGLRYPHLVRVDAEPDYVSPIAAPKP